MMAELKLEKNVFKNYSLTSEMRIDKFRISDVESLVDGIDKTSLEFLVSALNELLIADDIAKKLSDGKNDSNFYELFEALSIDCRLKQLVSECI